MFHLTALNTDVDLYTDTDFQEKMQQEEPFVFCCDECGEEILIGDRFFHILDENICEECMYKSMRIY